MKVFAVQHKFDGDEMDCNCNLGAVVACSTRNKAQAEILHSCILLDLEEMGVNVRG